MTNVNGERQLASIETISEIREIPDADSIEAVRIKGWTVVTRKGDFQAGDRVLFIEVDAALPLTDKRFEFLGARSSRYLPDRTPVHVLKTARLRGVYSQGIAFPLSDFPEAFPADPDTTIDGALGITKWEPPLPSGMQIAGGFPALVRKTDAERVQNLDAETWAQIQLDAGDFVATEKIDGSSSTVWKDEDGELHVASRNWELHPTGNAHWATARDIADLLHPGQFVQGEVAGPNIQSNSLKLNEARLFIFGFGTLAEGALPKSAWPDWATERSVPEYGSLELPGTVEAAIAQADGIKSLVNPSAYAEGVVWANRTGARYRGTGDRPLFKAISNKWLSKFDK